MPASDPSPPKRMTRARAKAVEEKAARANKPTPAKIYPVDNSRITKRKTRTDEEKEAVLTNEAETDDRPRPSYAKPTKATSTRSLSTAKGTDTKTKRGRPRKEIDRIPTEEQIVSDEPPARSTRARSGSVLEELPVTRRTAASKKVTFEDEHADKENIFQDLPRKRIASGGSDTSKVIRKSNLKATNASKSSKTAIDSTKVKGSMAAAAKRKVQPLSPKKARQVAKAKPVEQTSHELGSNAATPIKPLSKSPIKPPQSANKAYRQNTEIGIQTTKTSNSPTKRPGTPERDVAADDELQLPFDEVTSPTPHSNILSASPAKRPPPSPFKNSMRQSPQKLADNPVSSPFKNPATPFVPTLASKSPQKFTFSIDQNVRRTEAPTASTNDMGNSMLKSPAKRPTSPFKIFAPSVEAEKPPTASLVGGSVNLTLVQSPPKRSTALSMAMASDPFRAKSDEHVPPGEGKKSPNRTAFSPTEVPELLNVNPAADTTFSTNHGQTSLDSESLEEATVAQEDFPLPLELKEPSWTNVLDLQARALDDSTFDDSEDELSSSDPLFNSSPSKAAVQLRGSMHRFATPKPAHDLKPSLTRQNDGDITVLAQKFSKWVDATPETNVRRGREIQGHGHMFSPKIVTTESHISHFEEAMDTREDGASTGGSPSQSNNEPNVDMADEHADVLSQSLASEASQEYGDENAVPMDFISQQPSLTSCTPARLISSRFQEVRTVSKVPLKPAAGYDESPPPLHIQKKRSKSLSGALTPRTDLELQALRQIHPPTMPWENQPFKENGLVHPYVASFSQDLSAGFTGPGKGSATPVTSPGKPLLTRAVSDSYSTTASPTRTPHRNVDPTLLSGAVVFVDVHTAEGADASGVFVELLQMLGAKCVKKWDWNPRANGSRGHDSGETSSTKIGITHVVFKDGGKRTMERVREANGLVYCVGVGWVLDCERENEWLDESIYAIDPTLVPRGGHNRRKSMEPKAFASLNSTSPIKRTSDSTLSPTKQFLNLSSPARRETVQYPSTPTPRSTRAPRVSFAPSTLAPTPAPVSPTTIAGDTPLHERDNTFVPTTPAGLRDDDDTFGDYSPTTPYFLHSSKLVQQTCPPKQTFKQFFPVSGRIRDADAGDEDLKQRLLVARRKSLQWAPRVGSPLAQVDDED